MDGTPTWLARIGAPIDPAVASAAATRQARTIAVADAMRDATNAALTTVAPRLDSLVSSGAIAGWEALPYVGMVVVKGASGAPAAEGWRALRAVDGLGRIWRSREHRVEPDPVSSGAAPEPANGVQWNVAKVGAPALWERGIDGRGVTVGILDGGVDTTHALLAPHYRGTQPDGTQRHDYAWIDTVTKSPVPKDTSGHGSHAIGTAVGGSDASRIGVAPGASFIAGRIYDGATWTEETFARGINFMLAPTDVAGANPDPSRAPDVLTNSWGWRQGSGLGAIREIVKPVHASGITALWAAGNSGPAPVSMANPADAPEVFSVGATTATDTIASFSSRGPSRVKDAAGVAHPKPDVSAPGENILSAKAGSGSGLTTKSGTSMATPAVAGVAALLLSAHPEASPEQVRAALVAGAVDLGAPGHDSSFGAGRVDAARALTELERILRG